MSLFPSAQCPLPSINGTDKFRKLLPPVPPIRRFSDLRTSDPCPMRPEPVRPELSPLRVPSASGVTVSVKMPCWLLGVICAQWELYAFVVSRYQHNPRFAWLEVQFDCTGFVQTHVGTGRQGSQRIKHDKGLNRQSLLTLINGNPGCLKLESAGVVGHHRLRPSQILATEPYNRPGRQSPIRAWATGIPASSTILPNMAP